MKNQFFYFKITITYSDKNKLYRDFRLAVEQLDGTLIVGAEAKTKFKNNIRRILKELQEKHKRCKEIHLSQLNDFGNLEKGTETLFVSGSWSASIYPVKQEVFK